MRSHATAHSSFLTSIICVRSNTGKYQFCSCSCCLCTTPPAAPSTSLLIACTVSAALCCRQGGNPVAAVGTQQDSQSERTLALPDFFVCSDYFAQAWSVLSWDCITFGMTGNGYETSHCSGAPHYPDMKFCKLISVFRIAAVALWSLRIFKAWAVANQCGMGKSTTDRVQWSSPRPRSTPASYIQCRQVTWAKLLRPLQSRGCRTVCVTGERGRALLSHSLPSARRLRSPKLQGLPPLVQAQGRPRCLDRVHQKDSGYSCLPQLWPWSQWGAGTIFSIRTSIIQGTRAL